VRVGPIHLTFLPWRQSRKDRRIGSNMELALERKMDEVGENVNEDGQRPRAGRVLLGQDLEECNPEFLIIERQF
jgi:hypothetical protein